MSAKVALTSPGAIGADVCHLNLHKTFYNSHFGGGRWVRSIGTVLYFCMYLMYVMFIVFKNRRFIYCMYVCVYIVCM